MAPGLGNIIDTDDVVGTRTCYNVLTGDGGGCGVENVTVVVVFGFHAAGVGVGAVGSVGIVGPHAGFEVGEDGCRLCGNVVCCTE